MANPANSTAYKLPDGRMAVDVTEAKTLTVDDCGYVQNVTGTASTAIIVSVPATATLGTWIVRNKGQYPSTGAVGALFGGNTVQVSPVAADKIQGGVTGTATDNKDLITTEIGAEVNIINVGETNGPLVGNIKGTWTRE
jgi:hypothetical protein